jgi:hypothetical protein
MKLSFILLALLFWSCATTQSIPGPEHFTSSTCRASFVSAYAESADQQADRISKLFKNRSYQETIALGNFIRNHHRDKVYEVTTETAEICGS